MTYIKTDFSDKIKVNLCCGNCLYKVHYKYESKTSLQDDYYNKNICNIICLIDKNPYKLTADNQFEEELTCHMHELGTSFGGTELTMPIYIEQCNNNNKLKILFNLRPDLVKRFSNLELLQEHETQELNKWNK